MSQIVISSCTDPLLTVKLYAASAPGPGAPVAASQKLNLGMQSEPVVLIFGRIWEDNVGLEWLEA
jgi:hypothetical protein